VVSSNTENIWKILYFEVFLKRGILRKNIGTIRFQADRFSFLSTLYWSDYYKSIGR